MCKVVKTRKTKVFVRKWNLKKRVEEQSSWERENKSDMKQDGA